MGIIYTSFLSRNLLCKNVYTMPPFMWSNENVQYTEMMTMSLLYFVFSFLTFEVSYSKNINIFRKKRGIFFLRLALKPYFAELIFAIDSSKLYFADQIFAIYGQNRKNFCP